MDSSVRKQYLIFSGIIALILSFILNFALFELFSGTFLHGFPINIDELTGIKELLARLFNSIFTGALLIAPVYYFLMWLQNRSSGDF
jgi:hypothetical protein